VKKLKNDRKGLCGGAGCSGSPASAGDTGLLKKSFEAFYSALGVIA
jgi:hypothetical protein